VSGIAKEKEREHGPARGRGLVGCWAVWPKDKEGMIFFFSFLFQTPF
jgi:hypothetical protein